MYTDINFNSDNFVHIEILRIESLIEEQEIYYKMFFSIEPPAVEMMYSIAEYGQQIAGPEIKCSIYDFEEDFSYPFEFEGNQNQIRDEILIKERIEYESQFFDDEFASKDFYEGQIDEFNEDMFIEELYEYEAEQMEFEYDSYEREMDDYLFSLKISQIEKQNSCTCPYQDYMPNDDGFCDYLDCFDYPEGPNENLEGVKFY